MKEKEKTVVCRYCGQPHKVAVKVELLYHEEWVKVRPYSYTSPLTNKRVHFNPLNISSEEWRAAEPKYKLHEFLIKLSNRVAALEAALAEKGGEK